MKINITKATLLEGIQIVSAGVSSRTTLPILHNFLIEAQSGKIKLVRTDMEMATVHFVNAEVEEEGSLTVPMKEFSDIIKNLPDDKEINLYSDENNKFHIKSGKSKFWVIGTPKSEYPAIPEVERENSVALDPIELQKMIEKTAFSASTQETRYILNGLLWNNTTEKFEIVATDGGRLAVATHEALPGSKEFKIIIPTKILNEVCRYIGIAKPAKDSKIEVSVSSNQVSFVMNETTFISRLIEGNFPNYNQVIPTKKNIGFEVFSKDLLASTRRSALCSGEFGSVVKYKLENNALTVSSNSQNMEFTDELPVEYTQEAFDAAFNPQYIIDVLKNIGTDKVSFSFVNASQPVLVEPVGDATFKYVIMPVRA
ncbi:MAG: DNA polymerase III subunit beta [Elusimicrobia bacterium]|nr:DNA polymerase III subunit beta [Elusimicrobiota bacterium]MDY6039579.1 DNA polymerase III subunit beta [Elusimicrobiaceae bacterium]